MSIPVPVPLSLRRNFSWIVLGNVVHSGSRWCILMLLAKLGSPEMVGQYALALAIVDPVVMLGNLNLRVVLATDAKKNYVFSDYLGLRLFTTFLMFLLLTGITFSISLSWEIALIIMVITIGKAFDSVSDIYYGLLQQHERMDRIGKSLLLKGPLSLAMLGIGVYLTGNLLWGMASLAVAGLVILISYDIRVGALVFGTATPAREDGLLRGNTVRASHLWPGWKMDELLQLVKLSLPLGLVMMLIALNFNMPRYFIEQHFGERQLGIFAAIASFIWVGYLGVTALGQACSPRLAKYYAVRNYTAFRTLLLKLMGIGALLGVAGLVVALTAGQEILGLFFGPEYANHVDVLLWIMAAAGIFYVGSFLGHGISAARYFKAQVPGWTLVTFVTGMACFTLVPIWGLQGAAISLLIGGSVQVSCSGFLVWYVLRRRGLPIPQTPQRVNRAHSHEKGPQIIPQGALSRPRVSVIIPTYKRPHLLFRAIESVLNQTFQDFEVIIVNDGSNDNTGEVVRTFHDKRIFYIHHEAWRGGSAARNLGIRKARGQYIAFLDDDDQWLPKKLALQIEELENSPPEVGGVYTGSYHVDGISGEVISQKVPTKRGDISFALLCRNWVGPTSSVLLRKECFEKIGLFDEALPCFQDYDLWIRISKAFHFSYITKPLLIYNLHRDRISTRPEVFRQGLDMLMGKLGNSSPTLRKNYWHRYIRLGVLYCLNDDASQGRQAYCEAIRLYPFRIKPYLVFCLSFLGGKACRAALNIREKMTSSSKPSSI